MGPKLKLICLMTAVCVASCGFKARRSPEILVEALPAAPATLNPILAADMASYKATHFIFDSLITSDPDTLEKKPMPAISWIESADKTTYEFALNPKAKWHDDKSFTADDVLFTFEAIRDERVDAARIRSYFKDLNRVEKLSDHAVRFVFNKPYFKALSVIGQVRILPKHIYEDLSSFNINPYNKRPVGTGPFAFESSSDQDLKLVRFEGYYGKKPALLGMTFKIIPSKVTSFLMLKKQAIDYSELSFVQWDRQATGEKFDKAYNKLKFYPPNYTFIGWNMRKEPFSDIRVRQALCHLIDKRAINEKILFGLGKPVTGPMYYFGQNYDHSVPDCEYAPDTAARLLDEAGYQDEDGDGIRERGGRKLKFSLLYRSGDSFSRSVGLIMQSALEKAGVSMSLSQMEWAAMIEKITRRDFDAASLAFALPSEEDPFAVWHSSQAQSGSNFFGFVNERADALLESARDEFDPVRRALLYRQFHALSSAERPCAFLFMLPSLTAIASRFGDVKEYKLGPVPTEWSVMADPVLWEW